MNDKIGPKISGDAHDSELYITKITEEAGFSVLKTHVSLWRGIFQLLDLNPTIEKLIGRGEFVRGGLS